MVDDVLNAAGNPLKLVYGVSATSTAKVHVFDHSKITTNATPAMNCPSTFESSVEVENG